MSLLDTLLASWGRKTAKSARETAEKEVNAATIAAKADLLVEELRHAVDDLRSELRDKGAA